MLSRAVECCPTSVEVLHQHEHLEIGLNVSECSTIYEQYAMNFITNSLSSLALAGTGPVRDV